MRKFLFTFIILVILLNIVKSFLPVKEIKTDYRIQQATCERHGNIWNNITNECFYR